MHYRFAATALLALSLGCGGGAGDDWKNRGGSIPSAFVSDVWSFSATDTWIADGTADVQRYDGENWAPLTTPATGVYCVFALSATDVYLCGGTSVWHYDGSTFTEFDVEAAAGVDFVVDIWASSPTDIWAMGEDSFAAHYDGSNWTSINTGVSFASSIWGSGPSDVYVVGEFDFAHYDGTSFSDIEIDANADDGQVWGTGANDVWLMTDNSELAHFDGTAWEIVDLFDSDFVGDLGSVWGAAPDDLWAVGTAGSIAHWDGESWTEVKHQRIGAPYLRLFTAVHGNSATDIWAVGQQLGEGGSTPLIFHYEP